MHDKSLLEDKFERNNARLKLLNYKNIFYMEVINYLRGVQIPSSFFFLLLLLLLLSLLLLLLLFIFVWNFL